MTSGNPGDIMTGDQGAEFAALIARLEGASGPDRALDIAIANAIYELEWRPYSERPRVRKLWGYKRGTDHVWFYGQEGIPAYTLSLDAALRLLPDGFWWRGGTCHVSSEATVCPDHNDRIHRERLLRECPPTMEHWNEGIEVCLTPGSENHLIRALASACLRARAAIIGSEAGKNDDRTDGKRDGSIA